MMRPIANFPCDSPFGLAQDWGALHEQRWEALLLLMQTYDTVGPPINRFGETFADQALH